MKSLIFFLFLTSAALSAAQTAALKDKGEALKNFYLSMDVENLWLAGTHVNWQTGEADKPDATAGVHTHCSAFVAAACKRLDIYILRPPEHKQILLANAQYDWLQTSEAADKGWKPVEPTGNLYESAQTLANNGYVVVAICKSASEKKPGHTALVMPDRLSKSALAEKGPNVIMAGTHNHNSAPLKTGFKSHLTGWPENDVAFFYNTKQID